MSGPLLVRPAATSDVERLAALLVEGSREPWAESPEDPARYEAALRRIRATGGDVLVAEAGGRVRGFLQVSLLEHLQHAGGRVAEIESVHVDAAHRREGVGSALLAAAVRWAEHRACYRVQLTSHHSRDGAHPFYERNGFEPTHVGYKRALDQARAPREGRPAS